MRKYVHLTLIILLSLGSYLFVTEASFGGDLKWLRVGNLWDKVIDSGDQGYGPGAYSFGYYYYDSFSEHWLIWDYRRMALGIKDWEDETGATVPYKFSGYAAWSNEATETMPLPDDEGVTIRRYVRYEQPKITVDGLPLEDPFPRTGDEVAPDKIIGTADQMVESTIRTSMGVTIHQKVFVWSQKDHDDYIIYDWTFTNTGNIDLDDEVELPDQVLDSLYFYRSGVFGWAGAWLTYYGWRMNPEDSLRLMINYPWWTGADFDDYGTVDPGTGFLECPWWQGWAILHVDKSCEDHSDDPAQPHMTGYYDSEAKFMRTPPHEITEEQKEMLYTAMKEGLRDIPGLIGEQPYLQDIGVTDVYPGTHHQVPMDSMAVIKGVPYVHPWEGGFEWITYRPIGIYSCGPYHMDPGDSFRVVWAQLMTSLTPKECWRIGKQWLNGELTLANSPDNILPPPAALVYADHPEYDENDMAKDHWVTAARDSLFASARNARWAVTHNYEVPVPPPPPSIEVTSMADRIEIEWGNESESAPDFAGYKIYRALGSPHYSEEGGIVVGDWQCIATIDGSGTHVYEDTEAERGFNYYYYVAAFDDEGLESGRWLNYTRTEPGAARLKKEPGDELSDIRVVPNPYNAWAQEDGLQYAAERKIMFLELPPMCTIKIYNETGDLIRTIEHTDGSGDEAWTNPTKESYMNTSSDQVPVSGLYIARIETPDGRFANVKFLIVR